MSKSPRVPGAVDGADTNFGSVLAHTPDVLNGFFELYGLFWQEGSVSARHKELARLRNARTTDCGY